ncbi:MAG: helix-turn-helix domain-containing protein [Natrialbaceae archaeon]|nr:helix-turn-helix domain-containing protein [Natrialbaceae archaeon]
MRYVQLVIDPGEDGIQPISAEIADEDDIEQRLIHNINLLDDGTAVVITELSGDFDRMAELVTESDNIIEYHPSVWDERVLVYTHFHRTETTRELLSLFGEYELILDFPLEYRDDGGLRALVVGAEKTFRTVLDAIPDSVSVRLEQTGDYEPEADRLYSLLTRRQQQILDVALELGYYNEPRQATHKDIAEELELSDGTVGEHLRKIEATIFSALTPG